MTVKVKANNIIPECYTMTKECLNIHRQVSALEAKVNQIFPKGVHSNVKNELLKPTTAIKNQITHLLGTNYPMDRSVDYVDLEQKCRKGQGIRGLLELDKFWDWDGKINRVIRKQESVNLDKVRKMEDVARCVLLTAMAIFFVAMACIVSPFFLILSGVFFGTAAISGLDAKKLTGSSKQKNVCTDMEVLKKSEQQLKDSYESLKSILPEILKRSSEIESLTEEQKQINQARLEDLEQHIKQNL